MIPENQRERLSKLRPAQMGDDDYIPTCVERLGGWVQRLDAARLSQLVDRRRASAKGGPSGITAPPTLHSGGLDWLDLSVYGSTSPRFDDCCIKAELSRENAKRLKEKWTLHAIGSRFGRIKCEGEGKGYSHQPYVWEFKGIKFKFGAKASDGRPLIFVDTPGDSLLCLGEREVLLIIADVLRLLGVTIEKLRVRRVDACIDMPGVSVDEFYRDMTARKFTMRARGWNPHYDRKNNLTGIVIPGETCRLVIYDKLADCREKQKEWQLVHLQEHRWGGVVPECATRVEFRIRPGEATFADVRDLDALLESLGAIFAWATGSWFRMAEVKDRRHTERAKLLPLWREVVASFGALADKFDLFFCKRTTGMPDAGHLLKCGLGVIAKALAVCGLYPEGEPLETLLGSIMSRMRVDDLSGAELVRADLEKRFYVALAGVP